MPLECKHILFWRCKKLWNRPEIVWWLVQENRTECLWGKRNPFLVTMCSPLVLLLHFVLSAWELAGLHWGTGTPWTPGPSASAQTPHETPADTAGQGAADCPVQFHMRAPENSSGHSPHSMQIKCSGGSSLVSGYEDNDINASARLGLYSTFICCCFSSWKGSVRWNPMQWPASVIYEYLYEHLWKVSILNQDLTQKVTS